MKPLTLRLYVYTLHGVARHALMLGDGEIVVELTDGEVRNATAFPWWREKETKP